MNCFNYIIAGGNGFYEVAYKDIAALDNVNYYMNYVDGIESPILKFLTRLNFNLTINRYLKTPLKHIVFPHIFPAKFIEKKPLCFIFFGVQFAIINSCYIEYLKSKYPDAKFVLYMQDIVGSLPYYNINDYKKRFDLILSYDRGDCNKFGLEYFPTPFSYIKPDNLAKHEETDLYFCGFAKKRYPQILKVFRDCKKKGLKCKFFLSGVPDEERIEHEEIIYDKKISYLENLSYINSSKCILEIMQDNADGFTPRVWEAIFYNKLLLTNNPNIFDSEYYNAKRFHSLDDINNIREWIGNILPIDKETILQKSPIQLLEFIESKFRTF